MLVIPPLFRLRPITVQVGETGCGKTALVQRLAEGTKRDLVVQNLSLQTDGADLLGGFRPVELRQLAQVTTGFDVCVPCSFERGLLVGRRHFGTMCSSL